MWSYRSIFPLVRLLPPEFAHRLALWTLRLPWRIAAPSDPFTWRGLTFRNRVGIAAGFDKNAECVAGIERLGAGFVEVGTVLVAPWKGNAVSPRMARLVPQRALWNRLGFTSIGVERVKKKLARFRREQHRGMVVACNIGPHPGNLKKAADRTAALATARDELSQLLTELHPSAEMFVINLSSPNTPGLRSLLQCTELLEAVLMPLRRRLRGLDESAARANATPMLIKLPPEDESRNAWSEETLSKVLTPMLQSDACDGFVAVNTSIRLALEHFPQAGPDLPGGISGEPLQAEALRVVRLVRHIIGPERLLIGCGGIGAPEHVPPFFAAGANLVELYSGMIFAGPGLVARCAAAKQRA